MSDYNQTSRVLPFLAEFSPKDRQLAEKAFAQQEQQQNKAQEARAKKADELVAHVRRQLHNLLGAKKLSELRGGCSASGSRFATSCSRRSNRVATTKS